MRDRRSCPGCGKHIAVRSDGRLYRHRCVDRAGLGYHEARDMAWRQPWCGRRIVTASPVGGVL